jgi:hypothetical protein
MDQAGIYPSPLLRPTFVQCPLVAGYTTVRLYAPYDFAGSSPILPTTDHFCTAILENTGNAAAAIVLNQTGTEWYTGTRTVAATGTVQPGGRISVGWTQVQPYLEVACVWGGPAEIRMQLMSQMQWTNVGFNKSDTMYPQTQWAANYNAFPPVP